MGQWGFYDDEGDAIADFAMEVENTALPEHLKKCYRFDQVVKVPCWKIESKKEKTKLIKKIKKDLEKLLPPDPQISTWTDHTKKPSSCKINVQTAKAVKCFVDKKSWLETHRKELGNAILKLISEEKYYQEPHMTAGIAIYMARNWHSTPIIPRNHETVNRGFGLPSALPADFPEKLRKLAHKASLDQLEKFNNKMRWGDPDRRIQALKNQVKLFRLD